MTYDFVPRGVLLLHDFAHGLLPEVYTVGGVVKSEPGHVHGHTVLGLVNSQTHLHDIRALASDLNHLVL